MLELSDALRAELVALVDAGQLTGLAPVYDGHVHDGIQWILWIEQGADTQAVYFNNNFPPAVEGFALALDGVLARAGLAATSWQPGMNLDTPLWARITPAAAAPTRPVH